MWPYNLKKSFEQARKNTKARNSLQACLSIRWQAWDRPRTHTWQKIVLAVGHKILEFTRDFVIDEN